MNRSHWLTVLAGCVLLATNPNRSEIVKQLRHHSKNYVWSISRYFATSMKNFLWGQGNNYETVNIFLGSFVRSGSGSFYIGICGFWIHPEYWVSIPGWFVTVNTIWRVLNDLRLFKYQYLEFLFSLLFCILFTQLLDASFRVEKFVSTFFLVSVVLIHIVSRFLLYPSKLWSRHKEHVGSLFYGMGSCCLCYLAAYQTHFRWNALDISYQQLVLAVVVMQLWLGHGMGLAGSVSGFILCALKESHILDEKYWNDYY
mmetsp:Transcript_25801/g.43050  ORF Transcript_25801/g.43050 Transcript_25801/m.43050 type:complete len:256 (-) Transcript_25801:1233-2000(-)